MGMFNKWKGLGGKKADKGPEMPVAGGEYYLIAGLGNPGSKYKGTRHNVGFETIDRLADQYGISVTTAKFKGLCGTGRIDGKRVVLLKPTTYMNLSGESIRQVVDFYKIDTKSHLIVINDDVELDVGRLRIRAKGSAGGHNGLKNIIQHLGGSQEFIRIRVGVGHKPEQYDLKDFVMGHVDRKDRPAMEDGLDRAARAAAALLTQDTSKVMSEYNCKA